MKNFWLYAAMVFVWAVYTAFVWFTITCIGEPAPATQIESLKKYQDTKIDLLQKRVKALEDQNKKWMLPPSGKGWEFGK